MLKELMRILGFEKRTRFKVIRSKRNLIGILGEMEKPYLHISAHGDFDHKKGTSIRISKRAKIYPYEVNDLWVDKRGSAIPKLVVLSACQMGHIDMLRAFSNAGCRFCVAPLNETSWEDAAAFSTIFYKLLIGEKLSH